MRCRIPAIAVALLSCVIPQPVASTAAPIVQDVTVAARALVPLLRDVRARIEPRVTVEPGTLPPSPFTGRNSTLFAVRIGVRSRDVDEEVVKAMDRLLRWDTRQPLGAEDRTLVERWLEVLQVKVLSRLAAAGLPVECDQVCVVQRLTNPDSVFGANAREQQEARDDVLLEALIEAVTEA
ncbi:MAG TPA: penicillin acylase family protein [Vicinamibacterales bacterium]|nr:penicillin acylase family protein [Vicinamibacterales bacterium]